MKSLSPEVSFCFYNLSIKLYLKYYCHVWAGAPSCFLEFLDKLQKQICRTVGPSLGASFEPQADQSLFYRYYIDRCSSEMAELFPLPYSKGC